MLAWIGATRLTPDGASVLSQVVMDHALLGMLLTGTSATVTARLCGALLIATAVLLASGAWHRRIGEVGAVSAFVLMAVPITLLLTNPVWMESLGGFPAIGSGQGVIKYPALAGIALFVYGVDSNRSSLVARAYDVMVAGVMLPLLWIGAMKFTGPEAAGIEPLLSSSPFLSWMLPTFGTQGSSNLIGLFELGTVALLATWWVRAPWYRWAAILTAITFLSTLSFLVTLPGWHPGLGFPVLSEAGVFIIKDLGLLASAIIPLSRMSPTPDS